MQIKVAKSAGFCFGVKRAVGIAEKYAESGVPAVTLGEIIHNPSVVEDLRKRGVYPVERVEEAFRFAIEHPAEVRKIVVEL